MAADPLVGKVLADRFEILERIGEGGTGVVYKAKQITVDRDIAIKVLGAHVSSDPQWVKRFHNEARAAAKLHHANTVQLIDFGQTKEGLLFIAMELLQGHSLRDEIERVGKMQPARALRIIAQACGSVGEAHSMGIIHRDIKPDNLYLVDFKGAGDFVKVLDFSVAKMDTADSMQTRAGIVFGTPSYMSPEQGRGAKLGPQSDIYAFGIVLYEMLNGKPPFDSKIPTEVVMMHLRDTPKPIEGIPDSLNRLLSKTLDKEPARRQGSCEELAEECEELLQEIHPHTPSGMKAYGTGRHGVTGGVSTSAMKPVTAPQAQAGKPAASAPANIAAAPQARAAGGPERTMIADAPSLPSSAGPGGQGGAGGHGGAQPSTNLGAPPPWTPPSAAARPSPAAGAVGAGGAHGTVMLPDSAGVVAFALEQAEAVRRAAAEDAVPVAPATSWSFWAAWVVLGVGAGLFVHFYRMQSHLGG